MLQTTTPAFICSRCARHLLQKTGSQPTQSRQYASRLRTKVRTEPQTRPVKKEYDGPSRAPKQQPPSQFRSPPPADLSKETLADRPWATTFTNAVWITSGIAFSGLLGWYGATYYISSTQPISKDEQQQHIDLTAVYDEYAPHFDQDVDRTEYWNGIMALRSRLVKQARGDVLESAAGTGRNSEYYVQSRVKSLTVVDKSKGMLEVAEQKWPAERGGEDWTGKVRFLVGDVEDDGTKARLAQDAPAQFDTVVQTLGLCSTDDPDALMTSLTKLVKPGGKILLLEHGQSYFEGLNRMLDRSAHSHAAKHGCWWNRDIGAIVARSGMETVQTTRTWRSAGTNWYVILRKPLESHDTIEDNKASSSH